MNANRLQWPHFLLIAFSLLVAGCDNREHAKTRQGAEPSLTNISPDFESLGFKEVGASNVRSVPIADKVQRLTAAEAKQLSPENLKRAAQAGDAEAQAVFGVSYAERKDYTNAVEWFRKAADQGSVDAQGMLGFCLQRPEM